MHNVKGGLLLDTQTDTMQGELTYYNVTQFTHKRQETRPVWREVESAVVREAQPVLKSTDSPFKVNRRMSEASIGVTGSLIMVQSQENPERLMMYEFVMPYLAKDEQSFVEALTSENARYPLFMFVIGCLAFYHLWWKQGALLRKNSDKDGKADDKPDGPEGMMKGFREHAKKHGKLSPKMQNDMDEIEAMMQNMSSFGDNING